MANVEFTEYRPVGRGIVTGAIAIAEGNSYTAVLVNETGLPNGTYKITIQSVWGGVQGKYMNLSAVIQTVPSTPVSKENEAPIAGLNQAIGMGFVEVTDGTLQYDLVYEFPTQGGGVADGTLYSSEAVWERWTDAV